MVAGVIPARAIPAAAGKLGAIRGLSRVSSPGRARRPGASGGLPDGHTPTSAAGAVAGLRVRVRHILEVVAVLCP
jgi:hypothetical protein